MRLRAYLGRWIKWRGYLEENKLREVAVKRDFISLDFLLRLFKNNILEVL